MSLAELIDAMPLPEGEPFPGETLRADGWVYRDIGSWVREDFWPLMLEAMGGGEYRFLALSRRRFKDDPHTYLRGQLFISPRGLENVNEWVKKRKASVA